MFGCSGVSIIVVWLNIFCVYVMNQSIQYFRNCVPQLWHDIRWPYHKLICIPLLSFFLRLLLPYERHIKGEQDKPLPLAKPRKQEGSQEKVSGAKAKGVGGKKLKGNSLRLGSKKDRGETVKGQEQSQVCNYCLITIPPCSKFYLLLI